MVLLEKMLVFKYAYWKKIETSEIFWGKHKLINFVLMLWINVHQSEGCILLGSHLGGKKAKEINKNLIKEGGKAASTEKSRSREIRRLLF